MNEDSIRLLCGKSMPAAKNAVNSFKQIQEFTADQDLLSVIEEQKKEHELIKDIACRLFRKLRRRTGVSDFSYQRDDVVYYRNQNDDGS